MLEIYKSIKVSDPLKKIHLSVINIPLHSRLDPSYSCKYIPFLFYNKNRSDKKEASLHLFNATARTVAHLKLPASD